MGSKRLKIDDPATNAATNAAAASNNKENIVQQIIRRSSCIFGFGKAAEMGPSAQGHKQGPPLQGIAEQPVNEPKIENN